MTSAGAIGELIRARRPEILRAWTDAAKRAASARNLTAPELASLMPEYLTLLGAEPTTPEAHLSSAQQALIERQLSNRLREGFNLSEILTEFAILGRCVQGFLSTAAEVAALYAELHQTSIAVTRIFNEHVLEDAQTMKRYARLLEYLASDASGAGTSSVPLREHLSEVLSLIVEAMGARSAALLFLGGIGDLSATSATAGTGAAGLAQVARELEMTTFAGETGATGTEAGEVPATAALKELGVGALLRIRLSAPDGLRCALYVGIKDERPFTASEVRRLEELGAVLTTHLDNARLRSALHRAARELETERELRERVVGVVVREIRGPLEAARSSARRLGTDPTGGHAAATKLADDLGRILQVVDQWLGTTPLSARPTER